ncbi:MAG: hypothetical protein ACTSRE_04075 [Promethearchaeota archaeon]
MKIEVKNPIYLILLNWIILLIGYFGIPLIPLLDTDTLQQYILSFLAMNFHLFGGQTNIVVLVISWVISISVFGLMVKSDWKIPLYSMFSELFVYLFTIILMKKNTSSFDLLKIELLKGFGVICGFISLLYIPILIRYLITKKKQEETVNEAPKKFVSKCPHCGNEYQSNPVFCYACSKRIITL